MRAAKVGKWQFNNKIVRSEIKKYFLTPSNALSFLIVEVINQPAEASGTLSTYLGGGKDELGALLTLGVIGVKSDVGEEMPFRGIGKALRQHFYFFV